MLVLLIKAILFADACFFSFFFFNNNRQSSAETDPDSKSEVKGQEVKLYKQRVPGSPLFIATPTDHDYLKSRNKKRQSTGERKQSVFPLQIKVKNIRFANCLKVCLKCYTKFVYILNLLTVKRNNYWVYSPPGG